jgi:tetratricopeptide (TPR) repeat protein
MGVVFRAIDTTLGREVAVKVLHERFDSDSAAARRFADEARVTGQLQHPAIPAVHDLGSLPDGRPFLAMKFVKGRTLAQQLGDRPGPSHERGRFLAIFEQVCQAVGFAHAHKVIHRDLKPANVMVGGFGEVQVMDWGLAKVLTGSGRAHPGAAEPEATMGTEIRTTREQDSTYTQAGSVLGTPAFMPPEQAGGEADKIDERADVFGLGAILAVVLTGEPPYVGPDGDSVRLMAVRGQLADCLGRLERCEGEPGLVALCRRCLAFEPADRPANGEVVAKEVAGLRAAAEHRAREAELERVRAEGDRARAEAETREQRKRRWIQAALGMTFTALVVLGGAFAWWQDKQAAGRQGEREVAVARARQGADAAVVLAGRLRDQFRFAEAIQAIDQAAEQVPPDAPDDIREGLERARADLLLVRDLDEIRFSRVRVDPWTGIRGLAQAYRTAFLARGMDPSGGAPAVGEAVAASPVRLYLVSALDDWARNAPDFQTRKRLLAIVRRADPGPWGDRLRDPSLWQGSDAVLRLAAETPVADLPPHLLVLLLQTLRTNWPGSRAPLAVAAARHPGDFWLQFEVGYHFVLKDRNPTRAVAHLRAALAVRPDCRYAMTLLASAYRSLGDLDGAIAECKEALRLAPKDAEAHTDLGAALRDKGQRDGAIECFREAIRLDPKHALAHMNLGLTLHDRGDLNGAIAEHKEAIRIDPKHVKARYHLGLALAAKGDLGGAIAVLEEAIRIDPKYADAHYGLGWILGRKGDLDGSIREYREAIRIDPKHVSCHNLLGWALSRKGDLDGAVVEYREAIRLDPNLGDPRSGLAWILGQKGDLDGAIREYREATRIDPKHAPYHHFLGNALRAKGDLDDAVAAYKEAVRLDPKHLDAHSGLGWALSRKGDLDGAIAEYREAIRIDPKHATCHFFLGNALRAKGDLNNAVAAFKEAVRLDPKHTDAHNNLGIALYTQGDLDKAIASYKEAIRLDPKHAFAHHNLGLALAAKGDLDEAIASFKEALRLAPKFALPRTFLGQTERHRELLPRLADVAAGRAEPKTPAEAVDFVRLCVLPFQKRYALAARLYARALAADAKLAGDQTAEHRYNAACCAALAGCGKGTDAGPLSPDEKAGLRAQALSRLRTDLAIKKKQAASGNPVARKTAAGILAHWLADLDLAGVRPGPARIEMPAKERAEWDALWAEVRASRDEALRPPPPPGKSP